MNPNKKMQALIIEDDSYISDMYKIKLESENFDVVVAEDGIKGLKELERIKPDIILLDVVMPKVDGFGVLKTIKNTDGLKGIPVIMLTNLGQKDNVERGLDLGASGYIIKAHFTPSEVVKKVKEILEKEKKA